MLIVIKQKQDIPIKLVRVLFSAFPSSSRVVSLSFNRVPIKEQNSRTKNSDICLKSFHRNNDTNVAR